MFNKIFGKYILPNTNTNIKDVFIHCPFHVDKTPSLSISTYPDKPVWHCLSCKKSGSWIGFLMQTENMTYPEALKYLEIDNNNNFTPKPYQKQKKEIVDRSKEVFEAYDSFFGNNWGYYGKKIYKSRGITFPTAIACCIGFKNNKWVLPIFRYPDFKCVGIEYRLHDFSNFKNGNKCYKAKKSPSCLSIVYQGWNKKKCVICEGFMDAYFMYQYLHEKNKGEQVQETIITPSCGVTHLPELLKETPLIEEYDEVVIVVDNDEAGNNAKQLIQALHKDYKFFNGLNDKEDFEEWYKRKNNS